MARSLSLLSSNTPDLSPVMRASVSRLMFSWRSSTYDLLNQPKSCWVTTSANRFRSDRPASWPGQAGRMSVLRDRPAPSGPVGPRRRISIRTDRETAIPFGSSPTSTRTPNLVPGICGAARPGRMKHFTSFSINARYSAGFFVMRLSSVITVHPFLPASVSR